MNSKSYAKTQGLTGCCPFHIIQQNGIAERKNRTIMEAARAILHDQDIPMHIWEKLPEQLCMYRTVLHIEYSKTRLLKKYSSVRNQKSSISEYSVVLCHTHSKREENKIRSFRKEGHICGIL